MLATLIASACAEHPSLAIEVVHDPVVAEEIVRTTITVYQSEQFSCEKVEFGDLGEDELLTGLVDEIVSGEGTLTMSRTEPKVIVARGFDRVGTLFAAGCGEKGVVGEHDSLTIDTFRVANVSINGIGLDDADPFGMIVTVTDPRVESIPDRIVSWRVHGPVGTVPFIELDVTPNPSPDSFDWTPAAPACTNADGLRRIHPMPPATIGGYATDVRVSWNSEPQRRFTTFTPVNNGGRFEDFRAVASSLHWCTGRIKNGTHRMVCLEDRGGPVAIDYTVTVESGGATFAEVGPGTQQTFGAFPGQEVPLQVFSVVRDATTRDAYMLTTKGRVVGLFDPSVPGAEVPKLIAPGERIVDAYVMQACGTSPATLLVHVEDPPPAASPFRELRVMAANGSGALSKYQTPTLTFAEGLAINQTGCVAELRPGQDPVLRQVGVVDITGRDGATGPRNSTAAFFDCDVAGGTCTVPMAVPRAAVGFLAADDPTSDPEADPRKRPERMVGATFDASGTVLSVVVLQPGLDGRPRPVELERITSAAFPSHLVTGRFDGDGQADLFWDIPNLTNATTNFQLSYARTIDGERLSALSATQPDVLVIDTAVADVTGDGIDDLIVMSVDAVIPTRREVRVIPSQAPIKADNFMPDPSCGN
jgi:hypothetical protein